MRQHVAVELGLLVEVLEGRDAHEAVFLLSRLEHAGSLERRSRDVGHDAGSNHWSRCAAIAERRSAGFSQRELALRLGVSQPRVAAIERSRNVTIEVLEQYVEAVGGELELTVRKGNRRINLIAPRSTQVAAAIRAKMPREGP